MPMSMVATIFRAVAANEEADQERFALVPAFRRQVERAIAEERWHFANHFCDKILAESPRDLESWLVKGHLAWRFFNDPQTALSCFRRVVILGGFDSSNACVAQARSSLARLLEQWA